jgi:hypothetical protein
MRNAPGNIETASAANHLEPYSRAERTPQRSDTDAKTNQSVTRAGRFWLNVLETATAPLKAVTKCNYARECLTHMPK